MNEEGARRTLSFANLAATAAGSTSGHLWFHFRI